MNAASRQTPLTLLVGFVLIVLTLGVLLVWTRLKEVRAPLPIYGKVSDFALSNHLGVPVSLENLRGQVCVADVIFTRCPLQCGQMTRRMSDLQGALPAGAPVKLISLTMDPEFDTPGVLKSYGERYGANTNRWWFLTGTKQQVGNMLTNSLRLSAVATNPEQRTNQLDLFTHSTIFVLFDKHARLRGGVESLEPGWKERILGDLNRLVRED